MSDDVVNSTGEFEGSGDEGRPSSITEMRGMIGRGGAAEGRDWES